MVNKFKAEINKVYFIKKYTLVHILDGNGNIQVDFKNYEDWSDKAIYLEKGQYIKFLSDDFTVRFIDFPDELIFKSKDVRILFKHLISLGYIDFKECNDYKVFLKNTIFSNDIQNLINISTEQWYCQNPFQANKNEYEVIFNVKDIIDDEFNNNVQLKALINHMNDTKYDIQYLIKNKLGITINKMIHDKLLLESKKEIAFTNKNIQEIAYDKGYKDPAYFNRFFKTKTGQTPREFRATFDYENRDVFTQNLLELIKQYHKNQRNLEFYANEMHMSIKSLSKKVKQKMDTSVGQLIRVQIIHSAKKLLKEGESIKNTSLELGFYEPNHFSTFFKKNTGYTPSGFMSS